LISAEKSLTVQSNKALFKGDPPAQFWEKGCLHIFKPVHSMLNSL
jgi:hypothetical protein